jgi:SAM-dependent methyltransferase
LGILDSHQSAAELKQFYAKDYRRKPGLTSQSDSKELFATFSQYQDGRLKLLAPYLQPKTKLLEVGCSAGMFLYHAQKRVGEITGIDFDLASAKYAAKKIGCPIYTTDIAETPLPKKHFDLIVGFQMLEHVKNPVEYIAKLKEYLAPGGTLAIEVPNLYDALAHIYDLPNHYKFFYHDAHLWYFTEKSLTKLMNRSGLSGKVHHQQDYNLLNHFHWIDTDQPDPQSFIRLGSPKLPLRPKSPTKIKKGLTDFIERTDQEYKKLLSDLGITSNIMFIGRAK